MVLPIRSLKTLLTIRWKVAPMFLSPKDLVAVYSLTSSEGHFVFIWWVHLDLTIARIDVHEVKEVMSYLNLYQLVDP